MKERKTVISLFILVFALAIIVNATSAGITVIDAEADYEVHLSSVIIPTVDDPIKEIFIVNEDASFDTSLFTVNIPTAPLPIKNIFIHLEDAKASEALVFPTELINDTILPLITNVTVTNITNDSATINWTTDEIATSVVNYGNESGIYTEIESDPLFVQNHSIALAQLSSGTNYYFAVNSTDRSGNSAECLEYKFTTTGMTNQLQNASFSCCA